MSSMQLNCIIEYNQSAAYYNKIFTGPIIQTVHKKRRLVESFGYNTFMLAQKDPIK